MIYAEILHPSLSVSASFCLQQWENMLIPTWGTFKFPCHFIYEEFFNINLLKTTPSILHVYYLSPTSDFNGWNLSSYKEINNDWWESYLWIDVNTY